MGACLTSCHISQESTFTRHLHHGASHTSCHFSDCFCVNKLQVQLVTNMVHLTHHAISVTVFVPTNCRYNLLPNMFPHNSASSWCTSQLLPHQWPYLCQQSAISICFQTWSTQQFFIMVHIKILATSMAISVSTNCNINLLPNMVHTTVLHHGSHQSSCRIKGPYLCQQIATSTCFQTWSTTDGCWLSPPCRSPPTINGKERRLEGC